MNRLLFICILAAVMGATCKAQESIVSDEYTITQCILQRFSQINDNIRFISNQSSSLDYYVDAYLVGWEHTIDDKEPIIILGHLHLH